MSNPPSKNRSSRLEIIAIFIILFVISNYALQWFFPDQFGGRKPVAEPVTISMQSNKIRVGNNPVVIVRNNTEQDFLLSARCPQPPVDIALVRRSDGGVEELVDRMANAVDAPCEELEKIPAGKKVEVNLGPWKSGILAEPGIYEASLDVPAAFVSGSGGRLAARFSIVEPGVFSKSFRTFITRPLFNGLIFIASFIPGHNLGIAIILLTIVVRLILLLPNQHALEGQRKLQLLQPRIEEIKLKFPDDAKRQQEETMKLWKEFKINPLQSCLPTLLQFPILIGLFYVIRDSSAISTSRHLLYSFYTDLPADYFSTGFLWMDLLKPEIYVFPLSLAVLQYVQMKMMFKKAKKKEEAKPVGAKKSWMESLDQQTMMLYMFPVMIGFFAFQFPAAVSLYWGASTIFGIVQQWFVLREKPKV